MSSPNRKRPYGEFTPAKQRVLLGLYVASSTGDDRSCSELAKHFGLNCKTASAAVSALKDDGYVTLEPRTKRVKNIYLTGLGVRVIESNAEGLAKCQEAILERVKKRGSKTGAAA